MANQTTKLSLISQVAAALQISTDEVNAVVYGTTSLTNEALRLSIVEALVENTYGVFICLVWKGDPIPRTVRNIPRYDYFGQIIEGLNLYLHKLGYASRLLVSNIHIADYDYFKYILEQNPHAGVINLSTFIKDLPRACADLNRPLVFLDFPPDEDETDQYIISMKAETVIEDVVAHLYHLGHRRIAFIKGYLHKRTSLERYKGYCAGLEAFELAYDEALVFAGNWQVSGGRAAAEHFLALEARPTAIIASNDLMAFGVMQVIQEKGLKIPDDISVVGFDDIAGAAMSKPTLTSVRTPMTQIGAKAGNYMVKLLAGESPRPQKVYFPLEIKLRESIGAASPPPEDGYPIL